MDIYLVQFLDFDGRGDKIEIFARDPFHVMELFRDRMRDYKNLGPADIFDIQITKLGG